MSLGYMDNNYLERYDELFLVTILFGKYFKRYDEVFLVTIS